MGTSAGVLCRRLRVPKTFAPLRRASTILEPPHPTQHEWRPCVAHASPLSRRCRPRSSSSSG